MIFKVAYAVTVSAFDKNSQTTVAEHVSNGLAFSEDRTEALKEAKDQLVEMIDTLDTMPNPVPTPDFSSPVVAVAGKMKH